MDRRTFFKKAGVASAGALAPAALAAPAIAQDTPKLSWRLSSAFPKSLDILYSGATGIAERVSAATDGNYEIQVYAGGAIVPPLQVLAAVVVGGTSLMGGEGKIFGTFIGAMILGVIQNGLNMQGVDSYRANVIYGALILVAVLVDQLKRKLIKPGTL